MATVLLGGKAFLIDTPLFADARGTLCPVEFPIHGFMPVRAFLVSSETGAARGGHGHYKARQLLMQVSGEIAVELRLGGQIAQTTLDPEHRLLLIEPGVWARQIYFGEHPALMAFSDRTYEKEDYFQDDESSIGLPRIRDDTEQ